MTPWSLVHGYERFGGRNVSLLFSGKWRIRLLQNAVTRLNGVTSQKHVHHEIMANRNSLHDKQRGFMFKYCMVCYSTACYCAWPRYSVERCKMNYLDTLWGVSRWQFPCLVKLNTIIILNDCGADFSMNKPCIFGGGTRWFIATTYRPFEGEFSLCFVCFSRWIFRPTMNCLKVLLFVSRQVICLSFRKPVGELSRYMSDVLWSIISIFIRRIMVDYRNNLSDISRRIISVFLGRLTVGFLNNLLDVSR